MGRDSTLPRPPEELALRGLGFDNHPDFPFRVELRNLPMSFTQDAGRFNTVIDTPAGQVTMQLHMTQRMAANGISLPFVEKYPICSVDDFEPVAQVFEHLEVVPTPRAYAAFHERIGEGGVAVAGGCVAASPIHLMLHELMHMQDFFVLYAEQKSALHQLAERMTPFFENVLDAALSCDAEVIMWGANYDRDTTWPPFFESEILPWLRHVGDRAHATGKLLLTHTDGENRDLLPLYRSCRFDVAESVCCKPMTSCSLAETRHGMGGSICVFGGIPAVIMEKSTERDAFESYMDELFAELGTGRGLILGVSDNVPPNVDLSRLDAVKARIEAFGST
jgi:uroporphyrinogen-III decarboxylase